MLIVKIKSIYNENSLLSLFKMILQGCYSIGLLLSIIYLSYIFPIIGVILSFIIYLLRCETYYTNRKIHIWNRAAGRLCNPYVITGMYIIDHMMIHRLDKFISFVYCFPWISLIMYYYHFSTFLATLIYLCYIVVGDKFQLCLEGGFKNYFEKNEEKVIASAVASMENGVKKYITNIQKN